MPRIYVNNSSANIPHIYAVDIGTGNTLGKWSLTAAGGIKHPEAISYDWKSNLVILSDIGDPQNSRSDIALWVVEETQLVPGDTELVESKSIPLLYPFGPRDAKAFAAHPKTGDWFIITYESVGRLLRFPRPNLSAPSVGTQAGINLNKAMPAFVTDACFTMDGKWLLIRAEGVQNTLVYNATTWAYDGMVTSEVATGDSITAEPDGNCVLIAGKGRFAPVFEVCLPAKYTNAGTPTPNPPTAQDPTPGLVTRVDTNAIREASGMAYSKKHSKLVWIHNDEVAQPQVYGISLTDGSTKGTFSVNLPSDGDPESIRVHPLTGAVWLGDLGDNDAVRSDRGIWVVSSEPNLGNQGVVSATKYPINYPGGTKRNCEAMMIHPISGSVYLITKAESGGRLFRVPVGSNNRPSDDLVLDQNKTMPKNVSDATFTNDGKWALIRSRDLDNTLVYDTSDWTKDGEIPNPSGTNSILEQCEGITMETDVSFLLNSETKDGSGSDTPIVRVLLPGKYRPPVSGGGGGSPTPCDAAATKPADVLDLSVWKVTLPTPIGSTGDPDEVKQPSLDNFEKPSYFYTACPGPVVVFNAPVNGATTSGSGYPRSELREMKKSNPTQETAWNSGSGTHTLEGELAFTHLPGGKPHVVGMQIHGADDDFTVLRLEGSTLYATKGDDTHNKTLMTGYSLGTYIKVKMVASSAGVKYYINDVLKGTVSGTSNGCYFKAGCYTQANDSGESGKTGTGYGEVRYKSVKVTHS